MLLELAVFELAFLKPSTLVCKAQYIMTTSHGNIGILPKHIVKCQYKHVMGAYGVG